VRLDAMERLNLTISAGAVAAGLALVSPPFAGSVALGAALEALNFRALRGGAMRLFAGDLAVGRMWLVAFGVRFAFLTVAIGYAIGAGVHPVGLTIGLSTIVPAVVIGAWLERPPVGRPEPGPPPGDPSWDRWNPWLAREVAPREDEDGPVG
jgi:hypothetical protein